MLTVWPRDILFLLYIWGKKTRATEAEILYVLTMHKTFRTLSVTVIFLLRGSMAPLPKSHVSQLSNLLVPSPLPSTRCSVVVHFLQRSRLSTSSAVLVYIHSPSCVYFCRLDTLIFGLLLFCTCVCFDAPQDVVKIIDEALKDDVKRLEKDRSLLGWALLHHSGYLFGLCRKLGPKVRKV